VSYIIQPSFIARVFFYQEPLQGLLGQLETHVLHPSPHALIELWDKGFVRRIGPIRQVALNKFRI
jgi:hypothetical protein